MLKLLEMYTCADGSTVEILQTAHAGPDYHVRYGLDVKHYNTLAQAQSGFSVCIEHARACAGLLED